MIKITSIILFLIYFNSCSTVHPVRKLASTTDGNLIIQYQVGEIKTSLLSPEAFSSLYGNVWVPLDGRSIKNTELSSLAGIEDLPNARGKFLRMLNMGEKGDEFDTDHERAVGSYQKDAIKNHDHNLKSGHAIGYAGHPNRFDFVERNNSNPLKTLGRTYGMINPEDETRPKNIAVYFYIKINSCSNETYPCL